MYRAAIIGCGKIGIINNEDPLIKGIYSHAGAYYACKKTELVAVCDIDREKAYNAAQRWNCKFYTDLLILLQEQKPEIISICTPDITHASILEAILNNGYPKAILIEKPLALDPIKGEHLVHLAIQKNIMVAVNYSRRFCENHQKIYNIIHSGQLGTIQKVSGYYTKGIYHNGSHWLDLAVWLISNVTTVQGYPSQTEICGDDPTIDASLKFKNGAIGFLQGLDNALFRYLKWIFLAHLDVYVSSILDISLNIMKWRIAHIILVTKP